MADELRKIQEKFTAISNQLEYQIQKFELKQELEQKKLIIIELKTLFKKFEDIVKN
jgi:hypothetical protein